MKKFIFILALLFSFNLLAHKTNANPEGDHDFEESAQTQSSGNSAEGSQTSASSGSSSGSFNIQESINEIGGKTGLPTPQSEGEDGPVIAVLVTVMNWILSVFLILALISFVATGLQFIFSFGNSAENAKKHLMYSIIAVLVVGGALIVVNTVNEILKGRI